MRHVLFLFVFMALMPWQQATALEAVSLTPYGNKAGGSCPTDEVVLKYQEEIKGILATQATQITALNKLIYDMQRGISVTAAQVSGTLFCAQHNPPLLWDGEKCVECP